MSTQQTPNPAPDPRREQAGRLREMARAYRRSAETSRYHEKHCRADMFLASAELHRVDVESYEAHAAALLAGAAALERAAWRPISEAHEDFGPIILIDINDPGTHEISHVCDPDWESWANGMTHFAQLPSLNNDEAAALARLEAL
jgi:hypothetical protein